MKIFNVLLCAFVLFCSCSNDSFYFDDFDDSFNPAEMNYLDAESYYLSNLKSIESDEQLSELLHYLKKQYGTIVSDTLHPLEGYNKTSRKQGTIPRRKDGNIEGPDDVVVSKNTENGLVQVFINILGPTVTNSCFYNNSIWDAFFGYEHQGGNAWNSNDTVFFKAQGTFILKLLSNGIALKTLPTQMEGYYDKTNHVGIITN